MLSKNECVYFSLWLKLSQFSILCQASLSNQYSEKIVFLASLGKKKPDAFTPGDVQIRNIFPLTLFIIGSKSLSASLQKALKMVSM